MSPTPNWVNFDNSFSLRLARYLAFLSSVLLFLGLIDKSQFEYIKFARSSGVNYANATINIPVKDGSVDILYSSHMLEHLDRVEASSFLQEAFRVLAPGGIIRLAVPDLGKKISAYNEGQDADEFVGSLHMSISKPRRVADRLKLLIVGPRHHHWMYDHSSLCNALRNHGFANPAALVAGETLISDPEQLNLREREEESLYVEAIKPA
ncbi:MAG: methyltransferase domain-containing protein [Methylococcus sp.]|nr:methyltransferase domain-containing protein [Methylococcus sp.]